MQGILLAGGSGTRLWPITKVISKQLLPIYDKPMIYYSLSVLMLIGIKDILIISTPNDLPLFKKMLGTGDMFGCNFSYIAQPYPGGIPQAFLLAEEFINNKSTALILGDNIFYGNNLSNIILPKKEEVDNKALIFAYQVQDPQNYGVVEFSSQDTVLSIEEKPCFPKSSYAIPGLYFYDSSVINKVKSLSVSPRGELEISDLNRLYLSENKLIVKKLGRGIAWLDTGTTKGLLEASSFIQTIQDRQGLMVACLEEIAFNNKWITVDELNMLASVNSGSYYGKYLQRLIDQVKSSFNNLSS